jgi:predicted RNA polymerase sigma factor
MHIVSGLTIISPQSKLCAKAVRSFDDMCDAETSYADGIAPAAKHWTQSGVLDGATVQGLAVGAIYKAFGKKAGRCKDPASPLIYLVA